MWLYLKEEATSSTVSTESVIEVHKGCDKATFDCAKAA